MTKPPNTSYEKLASIFNTLGDSNTLRIFDQAAIGFESGKETIKKLMMSPRKYYRSLKNLNDSGLILFSENKYKLSAIGDFMHHILFDETATYLFGDKTLLEQLEKAGTKTEIRIINNYCDLTSLIATSIEKSKSEILLVTRYLDMLVVQSIILAIQRNVEIRTITNEKIDFSGFIKLIGVLLKNIRPNPLKFVAGHDKYRVGNIPFSFIIVDEELAIFEIPDKEFQLAFVSRDKEVTKSLANLFWETWKGSKPLPISSL